MQKKTFGAIAGAGVILNEGLKNTAVTYITEGIETGLSVRDAVQNERVIAVLGKQNMVSIELNLLTNKVVLCLDNDGKSIYDDKILRQTIERLKLHGKAVEIALPNRKGDFNDVLKSHGASGVIELLNKAFKPEIFQDKPYKISMTYTQIKESIERISRENKLDGPPMKSPIIEQTKILQRVEMEIG